jgi:hypothetical protein
MRSIPAHWEVCLFVCLMVFNATFNNISVISYFHGSRFYLQRKPLVCNKLLINFIIYSILHLPVSWPWSSGSEYNYRCNRCLSPLMWVRISIRARCTTLCDKVCQWLRTGRWFSLGTPVSSTKKIDLHNITEIFLKVASNTITR